MSDLVGHLVAGKYRVVRHLASGGVAEVYEALQEEIGQRFALKVLKGEFAARADVADRFLSEARATSAVRHPGVVQIFDYGKLEDGEPYLIMELLEGENLCDLLRRRRKLPREQAVGLTIQMLDALGAAHRAGIVHRDLKPENVVLVRGPGDEPWAKLIDFGIARLPQEGATAMRRTAQGTVMGTPYYMSPEQARGASDIDGRTDVYSAGVMLYEMLTGELPYQGASALEILARALSGPFPSPRTLEPSVPAALDEAILKATMRKRALRFPSVQEFAQALRPFLPELVALQLLPAEDGAESGTIDVPPPQQPEEASQGAARKTLTPPPRRHSRPPTDSERHTIVVSRWTALAGAVVGVAVAAAAVGTLLVVLAERTAGSGGAGPGDAGHAVAASGGAQASPNRGRSPGPASGPSAAAAGLATVPAVRTAALVAAPAERALAPPPPAAPPPAAQALVRLVGLPAGAQATLDVIPVGPEFAVKVSAAVHTLRVVARGHKPFIHEFRVGGDLEIQVSLEPARSGAVRPPVEPPTSPLPAGATDIASGASPPRPLANPFGEP